MLTISNPVLPEFLCNILAWFDDMVPVGLGANLTGRHGAILALAPVNPVGITGVGNSVGNVAVNPVIVVPETANRILIRHVTRFPICV